MTVAQTRVTGFSRLATPQPRQRNRRGSGLLIIGVVAVPMLVGTVGAAVIFVIALLLGP